MITLNSILSGCYRRCGE